MNKKQMSDMELLMSGPDYYGKLWTMKHTNPKLHKEIMEMKKMNGD